MAHRLLRLNLVDLSVRLTAHRLIDSLMSVTSVGQKGRETHEMGTPDSGGLFDAALR